MCGIGKLLSVEICENYGLRYFKLKITFILLIFFSFKAVKRSQFYYNYYTILKKNGKKYSKADISFLPFKRCETFGRRYFKREKKLIFKTDFIQACKEVTILPSCKETVKRNIQKRISFL